MKRWAGLCLFLSGFSGLVYQVVWVRLAFGHFGILTPILSVVVSVFMLGLGVGSGFSGTVLEHWKRAGQPALRLYALLELGIAASATLVPTLFDFSRHVLLSTGDMNSFSYLFLSALFIAAVLFVPCVLMGLTVPVMMAARREWDHAAIPQGFSFLYVMNVLGATAGTVLSAGVLIELFGFRGTAGIAISVNVATGLLAATLARNTTPVNAPFVEERPTTLIPPSPTLVATVPLILFVTGFITLAAEVLWTRNFTPLLGTSIYAFATVLTIYLVGTAAGALFYRLGSTSVPSLASLFFFALPFALLFTVLLNDPRAQSGLMSMTFSIFIFSALLGYLTPYWTDLYSQGDPRQAGWAYTANVLGCVLGPLVTSYGFLPAWGVRHTVIVLSGLALLLVVRALGFQRRRAMGVTLAWILCAWTAHRWLITFEEYIPYPGPSEVRRDYAATVISCGTGFDRHLLVNGVGITTLTPITKMMVHLPMWAHPTPVKKALLICFGMGTSYRSMLSWGVDTTVVELIPSVRNAFAFYHPDTAAVLANPRGHIVIDDGRRYMQRTNDLYDVIALDPPPPVEAAGSGLLYSQECYDLIKRHLAPHGVLQQWWPGGERRTLAAVAETLAHNFPYILVYKGLGGFGFHFLCSMEPLIMPDPVHLAASLPPAVQTDFLEWAPGFRLLDLIQPVTAVPLSMEKILQLGNGTSIDDDHPFNEYYWVRRRLVPFFTGKKVPYTH